MLSTEAPGSKEHDVDSLISTGRTPRPQVTRMQSATNTPRQCHHCGRDIGTIERVGRRDACLQCRADLHCCLNCTFYEPTYHNQCRETQAERQVDKQVGNFCDYFAFRSGQRTASGPTSTARDRLTALFKKG